jgi:hypothetical protein
MIRLASGTFAVILAALLTVAVATPANAITVDPNGPQPINMLPSVVKGAAPTTGGPLANWYAQVLYSFKRNPAFWSAAAAVNAGTATSSQLTLVQSANGTWQMPATASSNLTKVVGGVGTVIAGYSAGVTVGAGALDVARELGLISYNPDGVVCAAVGTTFAGLFGADCTAFNEIPEGFEENLDATSGAFGLLCNAAATWCVQLLSAAPLIWKPSSTWHTYRQMCFDRTVGTGTIPPGSWVEVLSTGTGTAPIPLLGLAATPGWKQVNLGTVLSRSGTQWTPNPSNCPVGTDLAVEYGWNNQGQPTANGTTWGVPDIPEAMRIGATGTPIYQSTADPLRRLDCIITASGQTFTASSITFRESDGILPTPVCPDVPGGLVLENTEIRELNLDDGTWLTLWSESTTPEFQAAGTLAPECANGTCMLDLRKNGVSCFQTPASCLDWFADPNKATNYSCHYGTHAVDLSECTVYAPAFSEEAVSTGDTLGDPETGDPLGAPAGSSPGTDSGAFGNPAQDPEGERECFPTGWAIFNPVEWVMKPVGCALEWAFVPRPSVVNQKLEGIKVAWAASTLGTVATALGSMEFTAPDGCSGIAVDMSWLSLGGSSVGTFYLMPACPGDFFAGFASATKIIGYLAFTIAGIVGITRQIGRIFGYGGLTSGVE